MVNRRNGSNHYFSIMLTSRRNPWHVVLVEPLPNYSIRVQFADGTVGEEDLRPLIFGREGTVFSQLRDPLEFARPYLVHGAVTWPCGVDIAPDALWERITGRYGELTSVSR